LGKNNRFNLDMGNPKVRGAMSALGALILGILLANDLSNGSTIIGRYGRTYYVGSVIFTFKVALQSLLIICFASIAWKNLLGLNARQNLLSAVGITVTVVAFTIFSNPMKKYSSDKYWENASVEDVADIPDEVLLPGNPNGAVLMWAASATQDPAILTALIKRGAQVNEPDSFGGGTPLTAAAGFTNNPEIIDTLIEHGANIHSKVGRNDKTALIIGAELNKNPDVIKRLVDAGSDLYYEHKLGYNALASAKRLKNHNVTAVLATYYED